MSTDIPTADLGQQGTYEGLWWGGAGGRPALLSSHQELDLESLGPTTAKDWAYDQSQLLTDRSGVLDDHADAPPWSTTSALVLDHHANQPFETWPTANAAEPPFDLLTAAGGHQAVYRDSMMHPRLPELAFDTGRASQGAQIPTHSSAPCLGYGINDSEVPLSSIAWDATDVSAVPEPQIDPGNKTEMRSLIQTSLRPQWLCAYDQMSSSHADTRPVELPIGVGQVCPEPKVVVPKDSSSWAWSQQLCAIPEATQSDAMQFFGLEPTVTGSVCKPADHGGHLATGMSPMSAGAQEPTLPHEYESWSMAVATDLSWTSTITPQSFKRATRPQTNTKSGRIQKPTPAFKTAAPTRRAIRKLIKESDLVITTGQPSISTSAPAASLEGQSQAPVSGAVTCKIPGLSCRQYATVQNPPLRAQWLSNERHYQIFVLRSNMKPYSVTKAIQHAAKEWQVPLETLASSHVVHTSFGACSGCAGKAIRCRCDENGRSGRCRSLSLQCHRGLYVVTDPDSDQREERSLGVKVVQTDELAATVHKKWTWQQKPLDIRARGR